MVNYLGDTDIKDWITVIVIFPLITAFEIIPPFQKDFFEGDIQISYPVVTESFTYFY